MPSYHHAPVVDDDWCAAKSCGARARVSRPLDAGCVCSALHSKGKKKRAQRPMSSDKSSKGLRHFSMKVCKKVEEKGRTTYNEVKKRAPRAIARPAHRKSRHPPQVADELVKEFVSAQSSGDAKVVDQQYDEKNIRRRVYDALNVLMAMDIISKVRRFRPDLVLWRAAHHPGVPQEKKEIRWIGIPTNAQNDLDMLRNEKNSRTRTIAKKREHLHELLAQVGTASARGWVRVARSCLYRVRRSSKWRSQIS